MLSSSQNGPPKSTGQTQSLTICHNKTTVTSSKISQRDPSPESIRKGESPSLESRSTAVTRTSSIHQLIAPGGIKLLLTIVALFIFLAGREKQKMSIT